MPTTEKLLREMFRRLDEAYGDQKWWPGGTPFEVAAGAVLTQNTAWANVEKAIANLKRADLLTPGRVAAARGSRLAALVKPAGYYNVKARRLKALARFLVGEYGGDFRAPAADPAAREKLLAVHGVGPETADSILLYACGVATFVVDAYTRRVLARHGLAAEEAGYDELKELFEANLPADAAAFNQYHALLVRAGRERCRPRAPRCEGCPLEGFNARAGAQRRWTTSAA
jgi:endonuclease-3 related protein